MSLIATPRSSIKLVKQPKLKRYHWGNSINGLRSPSPDTEVIKAKRRKTESHEVILLTPESETQELDNEEEEGEVKPKFQIEDIDSVNLGVIPEKQNVLLLRKVRQRYENQEEYPVPRVERGDEVLVKVLYVGLNPIDWKAPDFGFGIPTLPYIAGRDLVGLVLSNPTSLSASSQRVKKGDIILTASTDYRDLRKSAYQSYALASSFNVCRIPTSTPRHSVAGLGVAFIAAVLALGVCLSCDYSDIEEGKGPKGPSLRGILRGVDEGSIPEDVRAECLDATSKSEAPKQGDWILIWGGSSTTAKLLAQLSKLLGLRIIKVVDVGKHGEKLSLGSADLLVDSHDPDRAIEIIRKVTKGQLRFAIDTIGKQTAELCQRALRQESSGQRSHLVGLTGLPKENIEGVVHHTVPIKVHHEVQEVGEAIMVWLEKLLQDGSVSPPEAEIAPGGLNGINDALDRMRKGEVSGKRLIVQLD